MKRYFLHTIFLFLLVSVIGGCSTEKNTTASRAFHNITSQYNVYFNANESFKSGVQEIEERIDNDFTRILPIYKSSDPSTASMVKSDMDNAVEKSSKLIEIHSITKKPARKRRRTRRYQEFASQEEFNKWVDDAYLLMGKAYFYQKNYFAAVDNFSYVVRKYPDDETKHEANIWLIRSYSEMERYTEASEVIQAIQNEDDFPGKLERELAVATADYYMKQKLYAEAIKFLDIAISKTVLKKNKTRLQYIVAQLYHEIGMDDKASAAYREVLKLNPDYNMAFNARINAAGVFAGTGDKDKMLKELNKMLRDKKNIDFRDQIYYAIANIFFKEGNRDQAIDNYAKSVATSFQNQHQRALSAITLADIYLEELQYLKSQAYYDSAMIIVDENYPNYQSLQNRYKSLTSLVDQLMIVEREDSLQMVAKMPDAQREALISQLIKEEQEYQRNQENLALQGGGQNSNYYRANRNRMGMGNQQTGAGWYFYNPQTVSYGRVTFQQVWGQRKLEDNWRRSNKTTFSMDEFEEMEEAVDSSELIVMVDDPLQKEFYTQYLPLTDSMMTISHTKIRDALYNSGKIFKSEFNNYERSAESFENLNSRYPENMYLLSSYFDLYDLYELMGDSENSIKYRNLIISQFPDSKYAQYLQNPNFFIEMEARTDSINKLYQDAFRNYKGGYYRGVITLAQQIKSMQPDSLMIPKIDFMATVANGTQTNVHEFENLLEGYIGTYPNEEPTPLAKEILKLIQDSTLADYQKLVDMGYISEEIQNQELLAVNLMADDEFGGKYSYDEDLLHYFVVAYPREAKVDINRLKYDIANYNIDHYTKIDYDIETDNLDENTTFLLVRAIENKDAALIYHGAIIRKATVFQALKDIDYYNFVISSTNYREIMAEKSINDYLKYFIKNYSRFIESNFIEDENEISPEELMARAKAEDEVLQERGEFVVVNTGAEKYFNLSIDTTQNFVIAIQDKNISLRQVLNQFAAFNQEEFRGWNLAIQITQTDEYQLVVVSGIPTLNESMSYFRRVLVERSLFESLGQTSYQILLTTNENLQKMIEQNKVKESIEFFRSYYIQSAGSQQSSSSTNTSTTPATPVTSTVPQTDPANNETAQVENRSEEYTGPYHVEIETEQYFVFVVPTLNIDQPAFISGIEQFNTANYASLDLKVEVQPLDEIRQIVLISGLTNRETAQPYFTKVVNNRDLYTPLRDGNYRNFLITKENYEIFLKEKNINDYMDFYRRFYLDQ